MQAKTQSIPDMQYSSYIPTHLRKYITTPLTIPGTQNPKVQEYMRYKGVDFCDLHLEDALINGYWRLAKYYISKGILSHSTTFFNNLDSMDFKKLIRVPRKLVEYPPFYEYGYISPLGYDEYAGLMIPIQKPDLEAHAPDSFEDSGLRNIFVWELALQMAARFASVYVCDGIRLEIGRIVSKSKYLTTCHIAMRQAALRGSRSILRKLHHLNPSNAQVQILYADACTPSFMQEITNIVGERDHSTSLKQSGPMDVLDAAISRRDVDIYRKITTFPWIQKINIRNGILVEHATRESFLEERAACYGFYEVVDMPWLYDEFPPDIDFNNLPDVIKVSTYTDDGLRMIKYIVRHPSGKSLARSGKLAQWAMDDCSYNIALWLVKQGYPPKEFNRAELLISWHRYKERPSTYLDEIVELCTLLGVEME